MAQRPALTIQPESVALQDKVIDILCPPDKSLTHRSLLFAGLAKGRSIIESPLLGADCRTTLAALKGLGVGGEILTDAQTGGQTIQIDSPGWDGWRSPKTPLDFGNSGTTTRLLLGILAATPGIFVTAWGDQSLSERPMGRVIEPLRRAGAHILARDKGSKLPIAIEGRSLAPCVHVTDKASAQVKSALILAGLNIDGETAVTLPRGSRDHTEKALLALGANLSVEFHGTGETIRIRGPFRPTPRDYRVPGDPSSAAFFCVWGALRGRGAIKVRGVLDNPTRTGFLEVLVRMGVKIEREPSPRSKDYIEPILDLVINGGQGLRPVEVEPELVPKLIDEIPVLAVAASFAPGKSRFMGVEELRVKESDRLKKTIELINLAGEGRKAWEEGNDLVVVGSPLSPQNFTYDPEEDHRMAMASSILAKTAKGPCQILDPQCVVVSFPDFFKYLGDFKG